MVKYNNIFFNNNFVFQLNKQQAYNIVSNRIMFYDVKEQRYFQNNYIKMPNNIIIKTSVPG